jgi:hypothetical protein
MRAFYEQTCEECDEVFLTPTLEACVCPICLMREARQNTPKMRARRMVAPAHKERLNEVLADILDDLTGVMGLTTDDASATLTALLGQSEWMANYTHKNGR